MNRHRSLFGPGLGESQAAILELLLRRGRATLAELEEDLELATETLRDHLDALAVKGLVERAGVRRDGPGRPRIVYGLSESGLELFPRREADLLRELTRFLAEEGSLHLLEEFFERRASAQREELIGRVSGLEGEERLREVARILSEQGFMAEVAHQESPPRIRLCNCPIRDLVEVSHLPCRAELRLVRELLGRSLHRVSYMPDGDDSCTYSLGEETGTLSNPPG